MKCKNVFSFGKLRIQNSVVFLIRAAVFVVLFFLNGILKGKTGLSQIILIVACVWTFLSVYEYLMSWLFPQVKEIAFDKDTVTINGKDRFTYNPDNMLFIRPVRITFVDLNLFLYVRDEEEQVTKLYWFGNVFWNKEINKRKEVFDKIISFETKLYEKYAYAYLCDNATEDNTLINIPVARCNKHHLKDILMYYIPASVILLIALFVVLNRPVFAFLMLVSVVVYTLGVFKSISFRRDSKVFINTAEITRKGIRIDNDFFSINDKLKVIFSEKEGKKESFLDDGNYVTLTDGNNTKRFWLGQDELYRKEQTLLKYTLDSLTKYLTMSAQGD